jgi:pilus assembly protein Flp/PilA
MRYVSIAQIRKMMRAQDGATAIEYAIIAGGISVAIVVGVTSLGGKLVATWTTISGIFG